MNKIIKELFVKNVFRTLFLENISLSNFNVLSFYMLKSLF